MSNTRSTRKPRAPAKAAPAVITFMGGEYKVAEKIGVWPQMQLARASEAGVMLGEPRGLAAVHALLENVIHPDDWARFQDDMISKKTDDLIGLLDAVRQATEIAAARLAAKDKAPAPETNGNAPAAGKADAAVPGTLQVGA